MHMRPQRTYLRLWWGASHEETRQLQYITRPDPAPPEQQ
jgi:hypothetical protein